MASKASRWTPLENAVYRLLKAEKIGHGKALVAVSGGMDSMLLLWVLSRLAPALKLDLMVVHVHHGNSVQKQQNAYRKKAQKFVEKWCREKDLLFLSQTSPQDLQSEDEARQFRLQVYEQAKSAYSTSWLFLGHHQDDLLETRLLRLLRGTGPEGLRAMSPVHQDRIRPFLSLTKEALWKEARILKAQGKLDWVEDPSNQKTEYLRNWLRQNWLPALEKKSPGATKAMARSLELLLESHDFQVSQPKMSLEKGIPLSFFLSLSESQKKTYLARCISRLKIRNLTQNHLKEILKHLDKAKNVHKFTVAELDWTLTKDSLFAMRRVSP